ncbi:MAG: hypothetical protein LBU35_01280 [Holosporales bacterium]|jgi:hypothetical protein|nr:hypothetical protein [Holosporales bacterium]
MTTAQSFILFGNDSFKNLEKAFDLAINYMSKSGPIDLEKLIKHVKSGSYPNFLLLQKPENSNEISVDESRKAIEFLSQKPSINGNRAVIIDSADLMSKNAANAMLKILEEPPFDSILILTTKKLMSILSTIRSRCIKIKVKIDDAYIRDCDDFGDYAEKTLNISGNEPRISFIKMSAAFLQNKMKNIPEFSKSIEASDLDLFCEICLLYAYFRFYKNLDCNIANTVLRMQELLSVAKNTYPDKQNLITAIWHILTPVF